jgi:hypothetical protein
MSEPCTRWETEGRLAQERGAADDPHFATCADCRAARATEAALIARMVDAGAGWQPPGDWEARVFARIAREAPARRFSWWYALFPALAAAGLALFLLGPRGPGSSSTSGETGDGLVLAVSVVDGGQIVRSETPKPGDALRVTVTRRADSAEALAMRIYRDDRTLVFACGSPEPPCPQAGDGVTAEVVMTAPGTYRSLVLVGPAPLPAPAGTLDADVAAGRAAGAKVTRGDAVRVW